MEEGDLTTRSHCALIKKIIELFDQAESQLAFLIGDNFATNRAVATLLNVSLIGCASYRLNLAVSGFLEYHAGTVDAVSVLMQALRTVNNGATLRTTHRCLHCD
ncbi:hypothetical protein JG687_00013615 [Phytophthora cactorum]|uniref:Uncharacterized protein n=1 Tax=Phytophthora cactorum TaxID=29920 RepID=A0A8T1U370_9STRA|nr:hypothetical protein JG687_00013615 [Phytophthora cactorum]